MSESNGSVSLTMNLTGGRFRMEVIDPVSRVKLLKVEISPNDFCQLLSGAITGKKFPCLWGDLSKFGWTHKNIDLWVVSKGWSERVDSKNVRLRLDKKIDKLKNKYGGSWKYRESDFGNSHKKDKRNGKDGYIVTFFGLIPPD